MLNCRAVIKRSAPFFQLHGKDIHHVQHGGIHGFHRGSGRFRYEPVRETAEHDGAHCEGQKQDGDDNRRQLLPEAAIAKHVFFSPINGALAGSSLRIGIGSGN
jgi:hypothetical protein